MGAHASPRSHRRRRMMSEINVVPYIDVMLVLLIIFMVTAPMIVTGTIDLCNNNNNNNNNNQVLKVAFSL